MPYLQSQSFSLLISTSMKYCIQLQLTTLFPPIYTYLSLSRSSTLSSLHSILLTRSLSVSLVSLVIVFVHQTYSQFIPLPLSSIVSAIIGHHCAKQSSTSLRSKTHHHLSSIQWHRHCCHRSIRQMSSQRMFGLFVLRHCRLFRHYRV